MITGIIKNKDRSELGIIFEKLREKIQKTPELLDVLEQLTNIEVAKNKQATIEINVKDFDKSVNTKYEKILKIQ